jgi:hypothetical protein
MNSIITCPCTLCGAHRGSGRHIQLITAQLLKNGCTEKLKENTCGLMFTPVAYVYNVLVSLSSLRAQERQMLVVELVFSTG